MSYMPTGVSPINYRLCHYGASRLAFRGPQSRLDRPYVAVIGGNETFGRFVARPFPALVGKATGLGVVNLGCVNAGVDAFLNDPSVMSLCAGARSTVIQLLGAQNLSNRFYSVHPRRNDRFLSASPLMRSEFPELDFAEIHFTRHLLIALQDHAPDRFGMVVEEIQSAWTARMRRLLATVGGARLLLWIGEEAPGDGRAIDARAPDPLFVTRAMIEDLRPLVAEVVEVVESPAAQAAGTEGMRFAPEEAAAAAGTTNAAVHREVAAALAAALERTLALA